MRGSLAMFGPAFVAAIAYVDPGNFSTNFSAGARYGYGLLWVVVLASVMAMPMQFMSAKIGIVTGKSLPEICREECPRAVSVFLWIQAELIAVATDLAEFLGGAVGLNLLFGVPPAVSALVMAVAAFVLLWMQSRGIRRFERIVAFMLVLIVAGFAYQLANVGADAGEVAGGLMPSVPGSGALYLAAGIVGATMMPHVVYLHSAMTGRRRRVHVDDSSRRHALRLERYDVVVALGLAGLVNVGMLILAARVFSGHAHSANSLELIHSGLGRIAGGGVALAFAGALLISGISSSGVGTLAGQTVMSDFTHLRMPLFLRRAMTMAPALTVLLLGVNSAVVLNFSQVVLSFGIPFALAPLLIVGRNHRIMGAFVSSRATIVVMAVVALVVSGMNAALLIVRFA
ncbi:MAG: Nramp family divalent metal transporter [Gordonia polyisoprenivorans]|nr:Nramp family divalent metal transporter [Gordonia polyisoprenivorans]